MKRVIPFSVSAHAHKANLVNLKAIKFPEHELSTLVSWWMKAGISKMRGTGSGGWWLALSNFHTDAHVGSPTDVVVAITNGCDYYCALLCRQITPSRLAIRSNERLTLIMDLMMCAICYKSLELAQLASIGDGTDRRLIRDGQIAGEWN